MTEIELLHAEKYEIEFQKGMDEAAPFDHKRLNNPRLWWRAQYNDRSCEHYGKHFYFVLDHEPFWKRIYKAHCEGGPGKYIDFKDVIPSDWNRCEYLFGEDDE